LTNWDGNEHSYTVQLVRVTDVTGMTKHSDNEELTRTVSISKEGNWTQSGEDFTHTYLSTNTNNGDEFFYKITEVPESELLNTVAFDTTTYIIKVKINKGQNTLSADVTWYKNGVEITDNSLKVAAFTNTLLSSVTISKEVTGGFGDQSKPFIFTITSSNALPLEKAAGTGTYVRLSEYKATITLMHDQSITLDKIPTGTTITVTETDYSGEGYTTTYSVNGVVGNGREVSTELSGVTNINFVNDNEPIPDTGISMDTLPYILIMLAVIGGIAFTIIRRRKDDELD